MNNDNPIRVSIIIPIYGVEKYIERCIDSVFNQTYPSLECILVNDCTLDSSMDKVAKKLNNYCGNIKFKIIHHKKNCGLSASRNTGMYHATGKYIYFLDSDDAITPNCIELLADKIIEDGQQVDFVISDYERIEETKHNSNQKCTLRLSKGYYSGNKIIFDCYLSGKMYVMAWNKLVNKSFLETNNIWFKEGIIHEDELWSFMLASKAQSICVISQKTYLYMIRKKSITTSQNYQQRLDSNIIVTQLILDYVIQNNLDKILKVKEDLERRNRTSFIISILSNHKTKENYNNLRNGLHCNPMIFLFKDFKNFFYTFHFLLPKWLGYYVLRVCLKIRCVIDN